MAMSREEKRERTRLRDASYRERNKEAIQARQKAYRIRERDAILAQQKAYRDSVAGRAYHAAYSGNYYADPAKRMRLLVKGAILRAQRDGLAFDHELCDILTSNPPTLCACCERTLDYSMGRGRNNRGPSPSLDRIDPRGGYTCPNVEVVCMRCNQVKGNASADELRVVLAYMERVAERQGQ